MTDGGRGGLLRLFRRHGDVLVAVGVAVIVVGGTLLGHRSVDAESALGLPGWSIVVLACAALLVRRRFPLSVAVLTLALCNVYYPLFTVDGPLLLTFAVALYTVSSTGRLAVAIILAICAMLTVGYLEAGVQYRNLDDAAIFLLAGWLVAVIAIGTVQHNRLALLHETRRRAAIAERGRLEENRRLASEERLRIARELHDALGHNISLINVQAGAALHRFDEDPEQARAALDAVKQTSRTALRELRDTLGILRRADAEAAPTAPNVDRVPELIEQARSTGLEVTEVVIGTRRPLPDEVDLAAYRIVQEALTNVGRHAAADTARVEVVYGDEDVRVTIDDDGRGGDPVPGNGLRGMAERARALGGELTIGARRDGGFRVTALLPTGTAG
ncbi:sensor histidine kinase [Actinoalloteichus hymeniacidonis]|uniref:histidine kinase n=1 Tax=Actinoalloteichus hymeniacidonis TaxID=340345 RepID=A0AAC9MZY1_9PSEU|nr:sensor histidine kinase [Actinoalloteichus hymeniacidonis]AOS64830.1 signal transduction histidine kinase [Actinoalloteichus hymeniacidonis]MBB5907095.1 signal transduction histidine kinase [Actinoalloteichus hymeniacidonis]